MFRLKDAHVKLRQAMFDRDADAAWEHVDRQTRQQAGLLAGRIRGRFDGLPDQRKAQLRRALGIDDDAMIRKIAGKHLLVAPFFLQEYPHCLVSERDDLKLKDHGTKMAGPTAIVVAKNTPQAKLVPYTFTVQEHFGGQAMDYRARLDVPPLEEILGLAGEPPTLSEEEAARQALAVFKRAQEAVRERDVDGLWPLLDCESQSQASHFADQALQRSFRNEGIPELLDIGYRELAGLDGKLVWRLAWTVEELAFFTEATNAEYLPATAYDRNLLPVPQGARPPKGKRGPGEPVIQFESQGRTWQIPARLNHRNGLAEITLLLRPPFYLRLRK